MYLHQSDPNNYSPCPRCHTTGKVRCDSCGGSGCNRCRHRGGYVLCPRCNDSRSVFSPRRARAGGSDVTPPAFSLNDEPMTYAEALANAERSRGELIQWLSNAEWFYTEYKQQLGDWLSTLDLEAPNAEIRLNDYIGHMIEENRLVRELKERLKSLAFACFTLETVKRIGS